MSNTISDATFKAPLDECGRRIKEGLAKFGD